MAFVCHQKFALLLLLLQAHETIKARLFKTSNQRSVFVHAVRQEVEQSCLFTNITAVNCSASDINLTSPWIVKSALTILRKMN